MTMCPNCYSENAKIKTCKKYPYQAEPYIMTYIECEDCGYSKEE